MAASRSRQSAFPDARIGMHACHACMHASLSLSLYIHMYIHVTKGSRHRLMRRPSPGAGPQPCIILGYNFTDYKFKELEF